MTSVRREHEAGDEVRDDDEPWAALVRRLEGPTTWCATCAQPITDDRLWCGDECAQEWLS